jgi:hypothetical protein
MRSRAAAWELDNVASEDASACRSAAARREWHGLKHNVWCKCSTINGLCGMIFLVMQRHFPGRDQGYAVCGRSSEGRACHKGRRAGVIRLRSRAQLGTQHVRPTEVRMPTAHALSHARLKSTPFAARRRFPGRPGHARSLHPFPNQKGSGVGLRLGPGREAQASRREWRSSCFEVFAAGAAGRALRRGSSATREGR